MTDILDYFKKVVRDEFEWERIEHIGWRDHKHNDYYKIGIELTKRYSLSTRKKLQRFVTKKRKELQDHLDEWAVETIGSSFDYYGVSDDSFWDLTAHIVGLGKAEYDAVWSDHTLAKKRAQERKFQENFEYVFV